MRNSLLALALAVVIGAPAAGCKKKATFESCVATCAKIGKESYDRCLLDKPKELCEAANAEGAKRCGLTCGLAYGKPATSTAAASASAPPAPAFAGTDTGARDLLAQFVAPGADHAALSKMLRPTADDYRALFDAETATKIDAAATPRWDAGQMVIAPKPGQTEVTLSSATAEDLRAGTAAAKEFPGGYARVAPHLNAGVVLFRFKFVEPGNDLGMAFDGLSHVNGHWVIVPKPYRMVGRANEAEPAEKAAASAATAAPSGSGGEASPAKPSSLRAGAIQVNGRLPPEVIQRIVRANHGRFRACYERGLASNPGLAGRVTVKLVIDRSGDVTSAADGGSDLGSPAVVSCIVQVFKNMPFPAPSGGTVTVVYPLVFEPGH